MTRIVKENYYLDIAETVLERSTCLRRQYGAIIVRNDEIVASGYNGAPRGRKNCCDCASTPAERMRSSWRLTELKNTRTSRSTNPPNSRFGGAGGWSRLSMYASAQHQCSCHRS